MSFDRRMNVRTQPAPATIDVQPGDDVVVAGRWKDLPGPRVLLYEPFERSLGSSYTVIDEPKAQNGPSSWLVNGGRLEQLSRIAGRAGSSDSDRPGTFLITGDSAWKDYTVASRFRSKERGRIGVVFRFQDKDNYYRFFMDSERPLRRLEKKVNGVFTTLSQVQLPYVPNNFHDVKCVAVGSKLRVIIDGIDELSATDTTFTSGKVGFYCWEIRTSEFEDLVVTAGEDADPIVDKVLLDDFDDWKITGWTSSDQTTAAGPSSWLENTGTLLQVSRIGGSVPNDPLANPGTICVSDAAIPDDMGFSTTMVNFQEGAFGVVFRYKDAGNHYRFYLNELQRKRRLEKVVNGKWSVLWNEDNGFNPSQWYRIRVLTVGPRLRVFLDEEPVVDLVDTSHAKGTVGYYTWKSAGVLIDHALVQRPPKLVPTLAAVTRNATTRLHAFAPASANDFYGLALALSKTPSIPAGPPEPDRQALHRADAGPPVPGRVQAEHALAGFVGKLDAKGQAVGTINWPPLQASRVR